MLMNNKILYSLFISVFVFTLVSCGAYRNSYSVSNNVKKVELGMTKEEVVSIMGESYTPVGVELENEIKKEVIGYRSINDSNDYLYMFYFSNNKLTSWKREWVGSPYPPHKVPENTTTESK